MTLESQLSQYVSEECGIDTAFEGETRQLLFAGAAILHQAFLEHGTIPDEIAAEIDAFLMEENPCPAE